MAPIKFKDYYSVLGVDRNADEKTIKTAFRDKARKLHPDVNRDDPTAEEKFKELTEAHDVLSDKEKRQRYNTFGADWERYQHADPSASSSPQGGFTRPAASSEDFEAWFTGDPSNGDFEYRERSGRFSDFFNLVFGGQAGGATTERTATRTRPRRGQDTEIVVSVSLREAMTGTARQVSINAPEICQTCKGNGFVRGVECPTCDGTGTVSRSKRLEVRIPAGVHNGSRVRVAGQGGPGLAGGPAGDVYLAITVAPDSRFTIKGSDITTKASVPLYTAVLGGELVVHTVESNVALNIPPGTQQGRTFKLRGKGMPKLGSKSGERGDLMVLVDIEIPDALTDRERELFTELQSLRQ